ncbi:MAG: acylphosphatase [Desulfurivibrionaceae bacterium]|jgi:acylphosphatase|nr:acylphosphatase [Pseudomonadota bacterium]MCG2822524.1 acylphosphatase [Desulfobulbaceae bacterium]MDP2003391.1 acylphosphatase [Desulfurivibrionaceae bacterium]PKN15905.1 MAG: acylphosphatase [Deltaproteobacteria bacterium HGW-Deltaproteobacteria-3]MBU4228971.1 acylphosphatase [Pseudomonadota bacterium]
MARKRVVTRVEGVVQGVYFRDYAQKEARSLDLSGWVRNRPDGTVEVVLEGEAEKVERMLAWLYTGSPQAEVKEVQVTEEQPLGDKTAFAIRYN